MITENLNNIEIPELPKLTNGFVVVQEEAWDILIQYVQAQSNVINSLTNALRNLNDLHGKHYKQTYKEISSLKKELKDIALALEGVFEDE